MNVRVEHLSSVKKRLSVEVTAERVADEIDKAYRKIAQTAKIKGFRPGKVPFAVLEQHYAPQMEQQVLGRLINDTYFKALSDHSIAAVSEPEIVDSTPLQKGKSFSYEAEVEVRPEIEPQGYTGLQLQKERFDFDAKVIDERLQEMRQARAEMQTSKRKVAKDGDFVLIDFEGFVDGVAFAGGKAEGHLLELGSGSFIPGFEEQVVGLKCGAEKEIQVTFPTTYGNQELAGKAATFRVVLHEIREKNLPELDDAFAKGFGLESLAELREKLEESYRRQEESRIDGDLRERLVQALIERNPVEVPETMVKDQLEFMLGNIRRRLQQQGMTLEMLGMNEDSFQGMYRETAVKQVQGNLILDAVARKEKVRAEETELDGKLAEIAAMANAPLETVKQHYSTPDARRGLFAQVVEEKVIRQLLEQATIREVSKEELPGAQDAAKE